MIIRDDRQRQIARQKYESILRIKNKDKRKVEKVKLQQILSIEDDDMRRIFRNTCILMVISKGLTVASPWFLKGVVDSMSLGGTLNLN